MVLGLVSWDGAPMVGKDVKFILIFRYSIRNQDRALVGRVLASGMVP
jgi:hypothetical protein